MSDGLDIGPNGIVADRDWHFIGQVLGQHAISPRAVLPTATGGFARRDFPGGRSGTLAGELKTVPGTPGVGEGHDVADPGRARSMAGGNQ
jgi:hypothetical protein